MADAGLVAELAVSELGIRSGDNTKVVQMLEEALHRQEMLLVLDNFEHVVEAADLVTDMLQWSADLRVLVTSRARLRVSGEHVHEVHPLALAGADGADGLADAVVLFDQVATAVDPRFRLAHHRDDVAAICRAVDGLPLAIEIAGGHLRTLSPSLLRERLTSRLGSATGAGRDLPDRPQTIPATIDWSLQLVGPAEQRLFGLFSLFHGAVPLEAVEAVWSDGDVVDPLSVPVDHSWSGVRPAVATRPASGRCRSCASTPPGWSARTGSPARPPTRRSSRPPSTTSTSGGGPTPPTGGSTTSARCCTRCGPRTRGRPARGTCP